MPRPLKNWNVPDKVFKTTKSVFKKQIQNRPCVMVNGELYDIMEGSTYDNVMLKVCITKIRKNYYVTQGGLKEEEDYGNTSS